MWVMIGGEERTTPVVLETSSRLTRETIYSDTDDDDLPPEKGGHKHVLVPYLENTDQSERQRERRIEVVVVRT